MTPEVEIIVKLFFYVTQLSRGQEIKFKSSNKEIDCLYDHEIDFFPFFTRLNFSNHYLDFI
jgi:hypothetical protein